MSPEPENSAPKKQPWPFPFNILQEEWPEVKKAKFSFFLCAVVFLIIGGMGIYFLFDAFVLPGNQATIQALNTRISILNGTTPVSPDSASQVKKEALILANQMFDFSKMYKHGLEPYFIDDYQRRFSLRVDNMRNSLDQLGQDSTNLDLSLGYRSTQGIPWHPYGIDSNGVFQIASEIQTLANNLK